MVIVRGHISWLIHLTQEWIQTHYAHSTSLKKQMLSVKVNFNSLVKVLKILAGIQPIQTHFSLTEAIETELHCNQKKHSEKLPQA